MSIKKSRILFDDESVCTVLDGDMMGFRVTGGCSSVPDDAEVRLKEHHMVIERYGDGSVNVTAEVLVPFSMTDDALLNRQDEILCNMEKILGLENAEALTSASCWAGHENALIEADAE